MKDWKQESTVPGLCPRFKPTLTVLPFALGYNRLCWNRHCWSRTLIEHSSGNSVSTMSWVKTLFFKKLLAESQTSKTDSKPPASTKDNSSSKAETSSEKEPKTEKDVATTTPEQAVTAGERGLTPEQAMFYEMLARRYVETESGTERVKMIFVKDHKGETSPEMSYMKLVLMQVFIISFFMKYIPAWFNARKDFISANRATVFRTRIEAARRLNDHVFLVAAGEGASFSAKMTFFSAGFLFISQMISSYNNRSSVTDYTIAAGISGGLARFSMGPKGLVSGSIVGSALGTLVGGIAVMVMKAYSVTQEDRHLQAVISRLQVEKSIIGSAAFEEKVKQLLET